MNEIIQILIRTVLGYLILTILMRIMGKREVGQLSLFDLLILLTIVDVMVIGIENYEMNYLYCLIPMVLMAVFQIIFSFISLKKSKFRKLIDGSESIIIYKGQPQIETMKKQKYNMDDLFSQLRLQQIRNIEEVEYAILETSGRLSVFNYQTNNTNGNSCPIPLILSGIINKEIMKLLNYNESDLIKALKKMNIDNYNDVLSATLVNGELKVIRK